MHNKKTNKSSETVTSKHDVAEIADVVKIGIDVHAKFVVATRQFDGSKAQPSQKFLTGDLLKWIKKQFALARKVVTCYEAGPTGFWLHRELIALGAINYVVCPTSLDSRKKGVNTDKTDSKELQSRLDRYLAGNSKAMSVVTVPTLEQEQKRVLTRQRQQLRDHRLSVAAQGRTLMLLHGYRRSNHWWKAAQWIAIQVELPAWIVEHLKVFREVIQTVEQQLKVLTAQITQAAPQAKPLGLGDLTHEVIDREVADWGRFKTWRQAGSYAGLAGGVSASGQQKADLSITKAGNKRLRTTLIEAAWRIVLYQSDYWLVKKWKHILCNPKAHARRRKQIIVAFARQFFIDLWKWKTGQATPESLGWVMS
jgi:transposase